jgi:CubicO group peptidase (beta-lactamase class C family)
MIEKASGMRYRDYVRENIFRRVGMRDTDFFRKDRLHENLAEGSDPLRDEAGRIVAWKKNLYSFPPIGSPDGGAYVTAGDLDRFLRAVKAGQLLSPALTQAFFTPQALHSAMRDVMGDGTEEYGYGLWFFVREGQVVFCEKEGINAGVSGLIRHYPASDINVVLLSNMEAGVWQPVKKVHELIRAGYTA